MHRTAPQQRIVKPNMLIGLRLRNLVLEAMPSWDLTRLYLLLSFSVVNSHQVAKARNVIFLIRVSLKTLYPFD